MRSFATVLAAAMAAIAVAQVPPVDITSCASDLASKQLFENFPVATSSQWKCVQFDVAPAGGKLMRVDVPASMMGQEIQLIAYNNHMDDASTTTTPNENMWTTLAGSNGFLTVVLPQKGANDEDGLSTSWSSDKYNNYTQGVSLSAITGRTGTNHPVNGVYAFRGSVDELRPGTTTLVLQYPLASATTNDNLANFRGVLLYRFVDPWASPVPTAGQFNGGSLTSSAIAQAFGSLTVGGSVTVSNTLMPGDSVSLPINEAFARIGYAVRGLKYEVRVTQAMAPSRAAANFATDKLGWRSRLNVPSNYQTVNGSQLSFNPFTGAFNSAFQAQDSSGATQNFFFDYSSQWGPFNGTIAYANNVITREWKYPVDRSSMTSDDATLDITLPKAIDQTGSTEVVDWEGQSSPFWTLQVTLVSVDEYPMLGSESGVTLRNFDTAFNNGHNKGTPGSQMPFKLYMARISTPYWWRALPTFSGVVNLNKVEGGATSEGCMPRVEFQLINRQGTKQPNGWNPATSTAWKTFGALSVSSVSSEAFYPQYKAIGGNDMQRQTPAMTNDVWYDASTNMPSSAVQTSMYAMAPNTATADDMWLMVRVSAARRTLLDTTATPSAPNTAACGSNNIRIGSMGLIVDTIIGQCSSYQDCAVDGGDNPNKDQKSDSANNDEARFSNCYVKRTVGPNYVAVPTTKCMECSTDQHCRSGQYCHMDDGVCSFGGDRYYNCGSKSGEKYGVCREKSTDVLGKQCRHSSQSRGSGGFDTDLSTLNAVTSSGFQTTSPVTNYENNYGAATQPYMAQDFRLVAEGDAGKAFAKGAYGACGEYAFHEAGAPDSSASSGVRGALWQGFCTEDQVCVECIPGSTNGFGSDGKTCLNGKTFSAMDVDGTTRTFAENTTAGSILGTTSMIVLLVFLFAFYMYAEARRHRQALGLPDMTCCECLLCCGACSKTPRNPTLPKVSTKVEGKAEGKSVVNPVPAQA